MAKQLVILAGPDEGRSILLGAEVVMVGRSRATETPLTDPHIAKIHCQIVPEGNRHVLVDYDSISGTFVNGKEIQRHPLQTGDLIRIGGTHLQYVETGATTVLAAATPTGAAPATSLAPAAAAPAPKSSVEWAKALVGQTLLHYQITAPLARGKSGYVFHARDTRTDTPVGLKVLHPDFGLDDKKVQHFVEAMKAVLPLSHPHLLKVYGAGKTGTYCWVATEYNTGDSLAAVIGRIEKTGKIDWKVALRVGVFLARALEYAHQKNLIHENVTPQNILVGRKAEQTKLLDLMLAGATEEDPTRPISAAGQPSEALPFMSPERTDGAGAAIDGRTDVYSFGATLYAMLAGKPPFTGATVEELVEKIRLDEPLRLQAVQVQAPPALEKLLRVCLAKRVRDRYAGAEDLRKDLEKIAQANNVPL
jgi:serine/threonine protein kinase